jgi:hypothetical protein
VEKGTSVAGRVRIDATFGRKNDKGLRPVKGSWAATWGDPPTRSGKIETVRLRKAR